MIKLFATDMDGTFLDNESQLPLRTQEIVDTLEKEDKIFVVASGRPLINLEHKFKDIDHKLTFISDNGAIIKHKGEILYVDYLDEDIARDIIHLYRQLDEATSVLIKDDIAYFEDVKEGHLEVLMEYYNEYIIVDDLTEHIEGAIKLTSLSLEHSHSNYINFVKDHIDESINAVEAGEHWIDATNKTVNKGVALQVLMDKYAVKNDEIVVFGDYFNDLEMIKLAKYSYVVENGANALKELAYEVIGTNEDDSVINKILEHLDKENVDSE